MLIAACYVREAPYPFVELNAITHVADGPMYIVRAYSKHGSPRLPRRTYDQNHARTYWTAATRGLELSEEVFSV